MSKIIFMNPEISDDELDLLLQEVGIFKHELSQSHFDTSEKSGNNASFDQLLIEMMKLINDRASQQKRYSFKYTATNLQESTHSPEKKRVVRKKKYIHFSLLLIVTLLGGFFLGFLICLLWIKIQHADPFLHNFESIDAQIKFLVQQILEIHDRVAPIVPLDEMIELLETPLEIDRLAPTAFAAL